jgi:hypothetical protein
MANLSSLRPSKALLETYKLPTEKSTSKQLSSWTVEDDIRLVRAKERDDLSSSEMQQKVFPLREGISCKKRYNQYLSPAPVRQFSTILSLSATDNTSGRSANIMDETTRSRAKL